MLSIPNQLSETIIDHATRGRPAEVCGILGGQFGRDHSVVESVHEATNVAETPETRYAIAPTDQLELMDRIEESGEEVVGFYHSHPSGPTRPSETDVSRATWENRSYVIVTLDGEPSVNSWRWMADSEMFEREELTVR
jgi:proteasome lid subunit RPN8/RPN11